MIILNNISKYSFRSINLAKIRENNEFSQRKIAEMLNVSKSTYARWETQEQFIPLCRLNDFCNLFNVSMDYAMGISKTNIKTNLLSRLDKKIIGYKLKKIRSDNNLTQNDLAFFLNTTHSTISAYENGKTLILTVFALEICKKYNYSLDWLCEKKED